MADIAKLTEIIDSNKQKLTDNEYLEAMNELKKIYEKLPAKTVEKIIYMGYNQPPSNDEAIIMELEARIYANEGFKIKTEDLGLIIGKYPYASKIAFEYLESINKSIVIIPVIVNDIFCRQTNILINNDGLRDYNRFKGYIKCINHNIMYNDDLNPFVCIGRKNIHGHFRICIIYAIIEPEKFEEEQLKKNFIEKELKKTKW